MDPIRDYDRAQFLTPLITTDVEHSDTEAVLTAPFVFYSARLRRVLVLPAGARIDFASIPRFFWRLIPKRGKHDRGAALHDGGYRGLLQDRKGDPIVLSKDESDAVFLEAMLAWHVSDERAALMHAAVSRFGGPSYKGAPAR